MRRLLRLCVLLFAALLLGVALGPSSTPAQDAPFITVWDTENAGVTADDQIKIPGTGTGWHGDRLPNHLGRGGGRVKHRQAHGHRRGHRYLPKSWTVPHQDQWELHPDSLRGGGDPGGDHDKIIQVQQWGDVQWSTMKQAFSGPDFGEGASNLDISATDKPDLSQVKSMAGMFADASFLTASGSSISEWDVSSVTDMSALFSGAERFNQDIGGWDVSSVTNMGSMFAGATRFNQSIGEWDVSSAAEMSFMFSGATRFNQDISGWDVSSVTNMFGMFSGAASFDQDLGAWDVSGVQVMGSMLDGTSLSATNYDQTLSGWATQDLEASLFGASGVQYCDSGPLRAVLIESFDLKINDSGQKSGCADALVGSAAKDIRSDGTFEFGGVGLTLTVSGPADGDRVAAARYKNSPRNTEIKEENISQYRVTIAGGGIGSADSVDFRFAVDKLGGIGQPAEATVHRRPRPGYGDFTALQTSVDRNGTPDDSSDDVLSVTVTAATGEEGFGEFVFTSASD